LPTTGFIQAHLLATSVWLTESKNNVHWEYRDDNNEHVVHMRNLAAVSIRGGFVFGWIGFVPGMAKPLAQQHDPWDSSLGLAVGLVHASF
jgi:hypothetical protein